MSCVTGQRNNDLADMDAARKSSKGGKTIVKNMAAGVVGQQMSGAINGNIKDSIDTTDTNTQLTEITSADHVIGELDTENIQLAPKMPSDVVGMKKRVSKKKKRRKTASRSNKASVINDRPDEDGASASLRESGPLGVGLHSGQTSTFEMPCELNKGGDGDMMSDEEDEFENSDTEV